MGFLYGLFAITTFLSSFLLFQVQPLLGKHILPWFGGSSAVWVSAMIFFMVALAVGYIYAMYLTRLKIWYQVIIHTGVIILSIILIKSHSGLWSSAITPEFANLTFDFSDPVLAVFKTLFIIIGLPFALLSATSSLLQVWYEKLSGKEPFFLYGISNVGSLLGLLSYPLFFERYFSTHVQGEWWTYGFITYIGLLLLIIYTLLIFKKVESQESVTEVGVAPNIKQLLVWTGIASVPVMTMLAGTTFMTSAIAPVPFLWVGPLALYLISFVVTFRNGSRLPLWVNEVLVLVLVSLTVLLVLSTSASTNIPLLILTVHLALFAIYHWCHEYLYALRPKAKYLTSFYVALSIGGILGSLLIKFSTSYLLVIPVELLVILLLAIIFITYRLYKNKDFYIPTLNQKFTKFLILLILMLTVFSSFFYVHKLTENSIAKERNFFGYKAVKDNARDGVHYLILQHGMTNHGFQIHKDGKPQILPVSYYSHSSGIGRVFTYLREFGPEKPKIAIAGLGSGGLLAYCQPEDSFSIFEIDPNVYALAKKHFTYLENCPNAEVKISDARLALAAISQDKKTVYDLIVLDAYADDIMPIHLLTTEAMAMYKSLLTEEGIIAVNISSRYLDLLPVLITLAEKNNLSAKYFYDTTSANYSSKSLWVILAKGDQVLSNSSFKDLSDFSSIKKRVLWTDTYSALLPVVRSGF